MTCVSLACARPPQGGPDRVFPASRPSRGVVSCVALGLPGHTPKGVVPRYPPRGVLRDCSRPVPGSCRGVVSPLSGGFSHSAPRRRRQAAVRQRRRGVRDHPRPACTRSWLPRRRRTGGRHCRCAAGGRCRTRRYCSGSCPQSQRGITPSENPAQDADRYARVTTRMPGSLGAKRTKTTEATQTQR